MPKRRGCPLCMVELERVAIAGGSAVMFCAACDAFGDERYVAAGARLWPAGWARPAIGKRHQGFRIKIKNKGK